MSIKLRESDTEWLGTFLEHINNIAPIKDFEIESIICTEIYDKYLKKFIYAKEFTMALKTSQNLGLKKMLLELATNVDYSMYMRNMIIGKLDKSVEHIKVKTIVKQLKPKI